MRINMNEETMKDIWGIIAILSFVIPLIALPAILVYGGHRKFRPARVKAGIETQAEREPAAPSKSASRRSEIILFIILALLGMVYALVTGLVSGIFSQIFPIVLLYPVIMAFNGGKLIVDVIQRAKVRTISQLVFLSLLSAVTMYGTYHYCRYLGFQLQASTEIFEGLSESTPLV